MMPMFLIGQIMCMRKAVRDRVRMCCTIMCMGKGVRMRVGVRMTERISHNKHSSRDHDEECCEIPERK